MAPLQLLDAPVRVLKHFASLRCEFVRHLFALAVLFPATPFDSGLPALAQDKQEPRTFTVRVWESEPHQVLFPHETSEPNRRV